MSEVKDLGPEDEALSPLDLSEVSRVIHAAMLSRRVFSADALKGLQPTREGKIRRLKTSGAQTLFLLTVKPGLSTSEIAKELTITQSAVSFAISRLLEAKYIRAWKDPEDDRVKRHEITEAGRECVKLILESAPRI